MEWAGHPAVINGASILKSTMAQITIGFRRLDYMTIDTSSVVTAIAATVHSSFRPTLYNVCNGISMLGLNIIFPVVISFLPC